MAAVSKRMQRAAQTELAGLASVMVTDTGRARDLRVPDHAADRTDDTTPAGALTVHEQLVVRYITALINSIDRASILRDAPAPEHVYDGIERLLRIADGAA